MGNEASSAAAASRPQQGNNEGRSTAAAAVETTTTAAAIRNASQNVKEEAARHVENERSATERLREAVREGNHEAAKLHARDAAREKHKAMCLLKAAARMDSCRTREEVVDCLASAATGTMTTAENRSIESPTTSGAAANTPASSSPTTTSTTTSSSFLSAATASAEAVRADSAREYKTALLRYEDAIGLFVLGLEKCNGDDDARKKLISDRIAVYRKRAAELRDYLAASATTATTQQQ